mmetsp:Transcript_27715/g.57188  ORF Transcript_27715/g.57188 Transcript_27715/m.57188 type:complete len:119 (-) Transcript_27715:188-544(-)
MGSVTSTCCQTHDNEADLALEYAHSVLSQSEQDARPDYWTALQGSWYRAADNLHVGEINSHYIIWSALWELDPPMAKLEIVPPNTVKVIRGDEDFIGMFSCDAQPYICWETDEIWLKK